MTCAATGEEGMEAGRQAERRKANTANGGEIGSISTPKWDNHHSLLFFENLLYSLCSFFQNSGAKFAKTGADVSEKLPPNYCNKHCRGLTNKNMLHFLKSECFFLYCSWNG